MGSLSDNGGGWPPDGGVPDGLPELPPEWRDIVIPDDLSALDDEVAAVRAELRGPSDRTRWQRFLRRAGLRRTRRGGAGMRGPALIIAMAVLVTLASLWASAWPGPARPPSTQRTANSNDNQILPALELLDVDGRPVPLRGQVPAVILMIDGCDCAPLVADTVAAVRPGIAVITVVSQPSGTAPALTAGPVPPTGAAPPAQAIATLRELRDPTGELRSTFTFADPDGNAAVLLVDRTGKIVRSVQRTASVEVFRPDLARL